MTNLGRWSAQTLTTIMSTELNSLAGQTYVESTATYDNTSNLDMYADIQVEITTNNGSGWGGNVGPNLTGMLSVMLVCLESVDGTNFPTFTGTDAVRASRMMIAYLPCFGGGATPQTLITSIRNVLIPPAKFKIGFYNNMEVTLFTSGNFVKINTYGWNTRA